MRTLFLLRHGEAQKGPSQNEDDLFSTLDSDLSPRGVAQAQAARDELRGKFDGIVSSTLKRGKHTATIVGGEPRVDARLREFPVGGTSYDDTLAAILDLPRRLREEADPALADGKTWDWHVAQFDAAVRDALARHEKPVIVAHGIANRAWLTHVRKLPRDELLTIPMAHAEVTLVKVDAS